MTKQFRKVFREKYNCEPLIVRSPGRVNIIGEHTDYNMGFVLPASIDKAIYVAASVRTDKQVNLFAVNYNEGYETQLEDIHPTKNWSTYILGVTNELISRGYSLKGFNMMIDGDIPPGAGLSSSAALECAVVFALDELFKLGLSKIEMVKIAQQAEHLYAGVKCGIMDMFASMFGKKDHVIRLDCRDLSYVYKPLLLEGYKLVLFNTNVKHKLADSEYNVRRQQCETGVALVQAHEPAVQSLRDVTMDMLNRYVRPANELVYRRCRYIVQEEQRVLDACNALDAGNLALLGELMYACHGGLKNDYEVSCRELDFLVDAVKGNPAVTGARMMGGGFGGCTINIIKEDAIGSLAESLAEPYFQATGLELSHYIVETGNGTAIIHDDM